MTIHTDVVIIGAGPVGCFQVVVLRLLGLRAHVVGALDRPGGQCTKLYMGKNKLRLDRIREAALTAFTVREQSNPHKSATLQNSTTLSLMHQPPGVDGSVPDQFVA